MAMSRILAMNLGKSSKQKAKVISEFADKAAPVRKKARNAPSSRRKGKK